MRRLLLIALTSRILVLAVGYLAVVIIGYTLIPPQFRLSHNEFWNLPARFDAGWYLGIARRGYEWNPLLVDRQQNIAFFPLFPMAMRVAVEVVTLPAHILKDPDLFGGGNARFLWAVRSCPSRPSAVRWRHYPGWVPREGQSGVVEFFLPHLHSRSFLAPHIPKDYSFYSRY